MAMDQARPMSRPRAAPAPAARKGRAARIRENGIRWVAGRPPRGDRPLETRDVDVALGPRVTALTERPARSARMDSTVVPASVRSHFVQVGRDYFFADGTRGFTDKKTKLTTPSENTQLIRDLVAIARARGWQSVAVSGSERFRKEAWIAAREAGLAVRGYRASKFDETRLVRRLAQAGAEPYEAGRTRRSAALGVREPEAKASSQREHVGTLVDRGPAPYQHDPAKPMSYFVRLDTARGERDLWGVDLERAFRESLSRPDVGDVVVLRTVTREPVTVKGAGGAPGQASRDLATHRNRWVVEKQEFLERRQEAASVLRDPKIPAVQGSRAHPELLGSYLQMHAAELAAKRFADPHDRERFVNTVRSAMADSVARGEPLPAVKIRQSEVERVLNGQGSPAKERRPGRGREHE